MMSAVLQTNVPRSIRAIRHRKGWRQADLANNSGTSREMISRLERGGLHGVTLGSLEKVAEALGATLALVLRWEGAELDRLADAAHARLQEHVAGALERLGWLVRIETSFNRYGDRGRVDVLAHHPVARTLLVIEVKSAIGDLQETLGRLDVKVRLGKSIAADAGWVDVRAVVPALVIGDSRASRRIVARHATLFARFTLRGRRALAWIRRPASTAPTGLLWFVNLSDSRQAAVNRQRRVRNVRNAG